MTSTAGVPLALRSRRLSGESDAVHAKPVSHRVSPAQLYQTESGRLWHAGRICIILVGLPARGKTHHAVALTRYLRWLGVSTHAFHLGDYRRKISKNAIVPDDYFLEKVSEETAELRDNVIGKCLDDIEEFFTEHNGQVAVYDAVNPTRSIRRKLRDHFKENNISCFFVECVCDNEDILYRNIMDVKLSSPDYLGMDPNEAVAHYKRRIAMRIPLYEEMDELDLSYIKLINVTEKVVINNLQLGYLYNRIIFFLMNTQIKVGSVYFARAGVSEDPEESYKSDLDLAEAGHTYAKQLRDTIFNHIESRRRSAMKTRSGNASIASGPSSGATSPDLLARKTSLSSIHKLRDDLVSPPASSGISTPTSAADALAQSTVRSEKYNTSSAKNLTVWCSPRRRTLQTAQYFADAGIKTIQKVQLMQMNPGVVENMTTQEIMEKYPEELEKQKLDPYHHRYPRSESYGDLAVRMEPLIMEMERTPNDLLIIAHETVLRVIYGYMMNLSVNEIPELSFPRDELVEVIPNAYMNQSYRMKIDGVEK